jgi:adenosylcobinamide hydrolase
MKYFLDSDTLFLRGSFTAASTGPGGGLSRVSTIFNHTVPPAWDHDHPEREVETITARAGFSGDAFGLFTSVPMRNLCILQYDFITAFVTASVPAEAGSRNAARHTINIIVHSAEGLAHGALLETIMTATGAKAEALRSAGYAITGTITDAIVVACEGPAVHTYAGSATPAGSRVQACVRKGVEEALRRNSGEVQRGRPSLFIMSRFGGGHWVEWMPEGCQYYPCHMPGQRCDFCYCPFYPCRDELLGQWVEGSQGDLVWNCARCTLLHEPETADYLEKNPEASLDELKRRQKCSGKR